MLALDKRTTTALLRSREEKLAPHIIRSGKTNISKSKESSFTKLRSGSCTQRRRISNHHSCQFVNSLNSNMSTSTTNHTMGSPANIRRKENSSVRQLSQSVTNPATTSTAPT